MHAELATAKQALKNAEGEVASLTKEAEAQYKAECVEAAENVAVKLRPVIESVGGKVVVVKKDFGARANRQRNSGGLLECCIQVSLSDYGTANHTATAEPSQLLLKLEERLVAAQANVKKCQDVALEIRKKLSNVPMLERQARARLAEAKLGESADGRAVLEALTSEFETDFLALPSN